MKKEMCQHCGKEFFVYPCRLGKFCSSSCSAKFNWGKKEFRENQLKRLIGKTPSIETRIKMSKSHLGLNTWMKGRKLSKESCKKISDANKGIKRTLKERTHLSKIKYKGGCIDSLGYNITSVLGKVIREHRKVWIYHNQIPIPKGFIIHHIDSNKLNNNINNLILLPKKYHAELHNEIRRK